MSSEMNSEKKKKRGGIFFTLAYFALVAAVVAGVAFLTSPGDIDAGEEPAATSQEASSAPAPAAAPAAGGGAVTGVVIYSNGDPDTVIAMDADPVCASLHGEAVHTEKIVADNTGNLANAFVYVKEGLTGSHPAPTTNHVLNQEGCQPHRRFIQEQQPRAGHQRPANCQHLLLAA